MAQRSARVKILNRSDVQFVVSSTALAHGEWSSGSQPSNGLLLLETDSLVFQTESAGIATGTEGTIVLSTTNLGSTPRLLQFDWNIPFAGSREYQVRTVPPGLDAWFDETVPGNNAEVSVTISASKELQTTFRPSAHGWHFSNNNWQPVPNAEISIFPGISIPIGNASNGMCGGMTYSAIDYYLDGRPIPARTDVPRDLSDPDFTYIAQRLWDSFHLNEVVFGSSALKTYGDYMAYGPADRARVTIKEALPVIRADIALGIPSALGLIGAHAEGLGPMIANLGKNHQVCAYSYKRDGNIVRLGIYDCNLPDNNSIEISINADEMSFPSINHNTSMSQLLMFFQTGYTRKRPP
jgi:hypothetical protein